MYSFGIYLYAFIVRLLACFGHRKAGLMVRGQHETWRILRHQIREGERYVWFHAASLGEFEQGRPLMERLRSEQPHRKILLTFFSPSGARTTMWPVWCATCLSTPPRRYVVLSKQHNPKCLC